MTQIVSLALAFTIFAGEGEEGLQEGCLCYDDNNIVVVITQAISVTLAIVGGKGDRVLVGGHGGGGGRARCVYPLVT